MDEMKGHFTPENTSLAGIKVAVTLDGQEMDDVVMADTERGVIERMLRNEKGALYLSGENVATETLHGTVKVFQVAEASA